MKKFNIGILGATGTVGKEMLKILEERNFPVNRLKLLSSSKNKGKEIKFKKEKHIVEETKDDSFKGLDILLCAVPKEVCRRYVPIAVQSGAVIIDNSSQYRLEKDVPLIVPEINPKDILKHKGIIANPNCSTIIALVALNEINKYSQITRIVASTYQAVSGVGRKGIQELEKQVQDYVFGKKLEANIFPEEIFLNAIPQIGTFIIKNGYTEEEIKMVEESKKIFHNEFIKISCTCVRVPIFRSHSISLMIETKEEITKEKAKEVLSKGDGVKLLDDIENNVYPTPKNSANQDLVFVGRVRKDISGTGLNLWCCGDQIRKGAATNAVQIAELINEV